MQSVVGARNDEGGQAKGKSNRDVLVAAGAEEKKRGAVLETAPTRREGTRARTALTRASMKICYAKIKRKQSVVQRWRGEQGGARMGQREQACRRG